MNFLELDETPHIPKYKQVISGIFNAIEKKEFKHNQKIPSINEISKKFGLSRDTVMTALNHLQSRGIIISRPGKGYYIAKAMALQKRKIFLLFDKLTPYKETIFDAFRDELKRQGTVEIYFHNFNTKTFETLIRESIGHYTEYVIMPIPSKSVESALQLIPRDKLYILDRGRRLYGQTYPSVCQSFRKDIYNALVSAKELLEKYGKLVMIIPELSHVPTDLQRGFKEFCMEHGVAYTITKKASENKITRGEAYLVLDDNGLVNLVLQANEKQYQLGKDIGIISYNETPLKSIVANGITTISTDFAMMGKTLADLIVNRRKDHIENPCALIRRNSL